MSDKGIEERRFTAYKTYPETGERQGFVRNLTREEATDPERFPLGPQHDVNGRLFVWQYGLNDGQKI